MRVAGDGRLRRPPSHPAALGLEAAQRGEQRHELLDGAHALLAHAAVRRQAVHDEPEHQRAGLGGDHAQASSARPRRRRRPCGRAGSSPACRCRRPPRRRRWRRTGGRAAARRRRGWPSAAKSAQHEAALHVDGAAAVDPAVADGRVPGRRRPGGLVADRHDVDVAVEQQVAAGAAAGGSPAGRRLAIPAHDAERLVALDLVAPVRVARRARRGRSATRPSSRPASSHPGGDARAAPATPRRRGSGSRSARAEGRPGRRGRARRGRGARLLLERPALHERRSAAHSGSRSTGRVRHVGPALGLERERLAGEGDDLAVGHLEQLPASPGCRPA